MRSPAYPAFGLTLVVNHACNLRCSYCYTGTKFNASMPLACGEQAVRRAFASIRPGGALQLGFFGGEPLLEAEKIHEWMAFARREARLQGKQVRFNLTTNGTIATPEAYAVIRDPEVELAVSCDGTPSSHDQHRRDPHGDGSFHRVEKFLRMLVAARRAFSVVMVVRPDTVRDLPAGLSGLCNLGVTRFTLSPDVWTPWTETALAQLAVAVDASADLWRGWLPTVSIDWFDTRIAALAGIASVGTNTRCAFGEGEIAVAPSGRLYPCERLVGEDRPGHPLQLPGLVDDGADFLDLQSPCAGRSDTCRPDAGCRCSNYIRTGSTAREDGLLHTLDTAIHRSLARLIHTIDPYPTPTNIRHA